MILDLFSNAELLRKDVDLEDYLVDVLGKSFSVISLTYEYGKELIDYQTGWYDNKEDAIKKYKEDLEIEN